MVSTMLLSTCKSERDGIKTCSKAIEVEQILHSMQWGISHETYKGKYNAFMYYCQPQHLMSLSFLFSFSLHSILLPIYMGLSCGVSI